MSGAASDRNLLVGILAIQMDFIRREQLIAAMHAWVLEKQTPLEVILERQGALDRQTKELLQALVAKHLALHDNNPERSLQAVSSVGSVKEELRSLADPDIAHSLGHVGAAPDLFATQAHTVGALTSEGQRFRILRPHAKGGLGEVHVALDTELNREVALKEIQAPHADRPDSRARFTIEAEITGGLEHPGIVPVYGLGTYADGRPYYAMRFIRGDSLKEAIDRFHQIDWTAKEGERSLALRKLLGRFIDVCNAIEYAHSRGVLHRDLKPGNIMLGKYGETLVVDWGLAKSLTRGPGHPGPEYDVSDPCDERPLVPTSGSGSAPTQMGSAMGTPAYMSPEQAAGRLDELGPASDVYSLGATLYHVLTGQPPFAGTLDMGDLLRQVQRGAFTSPRSQNQAIPRPLEAICLKAMALKVSDRYSKPARLAEDIEHWLADEPTSAASETLVERSSRFVRKHKSWALATAATVALVALVSTAAAIAVNQQREANATLADRNLSLATAEKSARQTADARRKEAEKLAQEKSKLANDMRIELAKSAFAHGLTEYDSGRVGSADRDFVRALALMPPDHELRESIEQVAWDRVTRGGRSIIPPLRHEGMVTSAQFSADGKRVVTSSADKTARVWDAATGAALGEPLRHGDVPFSAQFSADGKRVVTSSADKSARVWDAATGAPLGKPLRHASMVISAQFSPDGKRVVTASLDKTARVWDSATGAVLGEPLRHEGGVYSAQFSPDGKRVVTASWDNTARVWDAATGAALGDPLRHGGGVISAQFSPDGKRVVTASGDATARLWYVATGTALGEPLRHEGGVTSAQFSPDGRRVVTASYDATARVWDAATGEALGEPLRHEVAILSAKFSPDGEFVVTTSGDKSARLWDAITRAAVGEPLRHENAVTSAQFSADGLRVVTASQDQTTRIWDAGTGATVGEPMQHQFPVHSSQFSPDGRCVATTSGNWARIWDVETSTVLGQSLRHEGEVSSAQFSVDGKRVVTASDDKSARVWDAATSAALGEPLRHAFAVNSAQFSPDGKRVITASDDNTARVWDAESGTALGEPLQHASLVTSAEFSPDGTRVITSSYDKTARVWNAATGAALGEPLRHEGGVISARFSPDGRRVVTVCDNATGRVWDAAVGIALGEPLRHGAGFNSAQFSPDGTRVVTASDDYTARIWDAATYAALGEPLRHTGRVNSAQFSPDGKRVITASDDKTARVWDARLLAPNRGWMLAAISLWSRFNADEQGRTREITEAEWSSLAAKLHSSNDPWPVALRAWQEERRLQILQASP